MFKIIILFILISGLVPVNAAMAEGDMTSHLICPCECAMIISTCDCSTAIQVKKEINSMKEAGFSEKQIFSALQAEYGKEILAHSKRDSSIPLWMGSILLAITFVFLGYIAIKKPNLRIIPDIPDKQKYEQQFEEEYWKFVSQTEEK
ncbi:MAG: cytochrome c-type biogenesis protein CcmH [Candidatus Methanoperedens sp.]|nr:cytochrome c-type biogenesis protein CcmH [Candidatus Methanoperedens sp.]